jgi:hypothetical protein
MKREKKGEKMFKKMLLIVLVVVGGLTLSIAKPILAKKVKGK